MKNLPTSSVSAPPTGLETVTWVERAPMCGTHVPHNTSSPPNPLPVPAAPERHAERTEQPEVQTPSRNTRSVAPARSAMGAPSALPVMRGTGSAFRTEQLAKLTGAIGARLGDWRWLAIYERWRNGNPVSVFHRTMLAGALARVRTPDLSIDECLKARPLPERNRP